MFDFLETTCTQTSVLSTSIPSTSIERSTSSSTLLQPTPSPPTPHSSTQIIDDLATVYRRSILPLRLLGQSETYQDEIKLQLYWVSLNGQKIPIFNAFDALGYILTHALRPTLEGKSSSEH